MRVSGDVWSCEQAARTLRAAAVEVGRTRVATVSTWRGTAAEQHLVFAAAAADHRRVIARGLADAAGALDRHAAALRELQARAASLVAQAAAEGLVLRSDGAVAPLPALVGPMSPSTAARAAFAEQARWLLQGRVAELQDDVGQLHRLLADELLHVAQPPPVPGAGWVPTWADLPPLVPDVLRASGRAPAWLGPVLRRTPITAVGGFAYGFALDVQQGRPVEQAAAKNATSVGAGVLVSAGAAAALAAAPVVVPAAAVVVTSLAAGAAVGWAAGRIWDLASPLPPARRPAPGPRPQPTRR